MAGFATLAGLRTGMDQEARMSQQESGRNTRGPLVRRHWMAVSEVAAVSSLAGVVIALLHPPMMTSTALVLVTSPAQNAACCAPDSYIAVQEVVAGSDAVLFEALPGVRPAMSIGELRGAIRIGTTLPQIMTVTAHGRSAADAEATADAVAGSYTRYMGSAGSPAGHATALLLQPATSATGRSLPGWLLIVGGLSALYGAIVGAFGAVVFGRADRRRLSP
jgi:hypothetical protein